MSIMVRSAVTPEEWAEFRKLAIDLGVHIQLLVAEAMRDKLVFFDRLPKPKADGR